MKTNNGNSSKYRRRSLIIRRGRKRTREQSPSLKRAVKAMGGTTTALALGLGLSPQAVSQWDRVPLGRIADVERLTGVPRHLLLRDVLD